MTDDDQSAPSADPMPSQAVADTHRQLKQVLASLDRLEVFQAGAYVSMAIDVLERRFGDLLASGTGEQKDQSEH